MNKTKGVVTIQIGKGCRYYGLDEKTKEKIFSDLTYRNKKYDDAKRFGSYVSPNIPETIKYFAVSRDGSTIWSPRGYIWVIKKWLKRNNYKVKVDDRTLLLPKMDIEFKGKLRNYQEKAVNDVIRRYPIGVLEAATGAGKTCCAIAVIAKRKQPTLIICHTKELLYQWQGAIKQFLDYNCGLIGDGKYDVKSITVGIINTVKNNTEDLVNRFGHIICDEVHRVTSGTWSDTIVQFAARNYLGLSATPFRNDGLSGAIYVHIGPKVHVIDKKMLHDTGKVLKPQIILIKTNFRAANNWAEEEKLSYTEIIKILTMDETRNKIIVQAIYNDLKKNNENILVVSDRVSHLHTLSDMLSSIKIKNHLLSGKTKKEKRKQIIKDVRNNKCKVLISTLSLISEGFDSPNLSAIFLTTPVGYKGLAIQAIGRILRPSKGKVPPRVFDFRDENVRVLKYSGFKRNKIYNEEWK